MPTLGQTRCVSDCSSGSVCIYPAPSQPIVRLHVHGSNQRDILFSGARAALASEIQVGTLTPRAFWVPSPCHFEAFLESVSLS